MCLWSDHPKKFLKLTKKGFVNIHASILPSWRGAAPIQRSIMNLDSETGLSIMKMNEELDSGPVSNTYKVKIDKNQNAQEISEKLSALAAEKILDNVDDILRIKQSLLIKIIQKQLMQKKFIRRSHKLIGMRMPLKLLAK